MEDPRQGMIARSTRAVWLIVAALDGGMAVAAGAYARHALAAPTDRYAAELFGIAAQYQMWHGLALAVVALLAGEMPAGGAAWSLRLSGWAFVIGLALFDGALYSLALYGTPLFTGAAPLGGFVLMGGWAALAMAAALWIGNRKEIR